MNLIYLYEGQFSHGDKGHELVKRAALMYSHELGLDLDIENTEILREENGKPYFNQLPIEFSLSHSGKLWMCMFGQNPCGLDLQIEKKCNFEKIAKRQYTKEEQHYVQLWGQSGFFDVWVRKEAFVKMTGQGLFTKMPSMVDENSELVKETLWEDKGFYFNEIEIADEIKCAICTGEDQDFQLRIIG